VTATLRRGSRTVAGGKLTSRRGGALRVRLRLRAAGRKALRRSGGRLELRLRVTPTGGRATVLRATAMRPRG